MLFALFLAAVVAAADERRLIDFGNGAEVWMTREQVDALGARPGVKGGFMDITDHPKAPAPEPWQANLNSWVHRTPKPTGNITRPLNSQLTPYVERLSAFNNRRYDANTGKEAAEWILETFKELAGSRFGQDVGVDFFNHNFIQPSVVTRVAGTSSETEICVLGGHEDSTAGSSSARAPGSDDDGTGTATVLEAFRQLMAAGWKPARPVEFHTYAAEEAGLLGSADIASAYRSQGKQVRSMLQMDMTAYRGSSGWTVGLITDFTDAALTKEMGNLISSNTRLIPQESRCGYACSDHGSWTRNNYPASFVFETPFGSHNPNIHTSRDTIDKIDLDGKGEEFVKLAMAYIQWCSS